MHLPITGKALPPAKGAQRHHMDLPFTRKALPPASRAARLHAHSPFTGKAQPPASKAQRHRVRVPPLGGGSPPPHGCRPKPLPPATGRAVHRTHSLLTEADALLATVTFEVARWALHLTSSTAGIVEVARKALHLESSPTRCRRRPSRWSDGAPLSAPPRQSWRSPCFLLDLICSSSSSFVVAPRLEVRRRVSSRGSSSCSDGLSTPCFGSRSQLSVEPVDDRVMARPSVLPSSSR